MNLLKPSFAIKAVLFPNVGDESDDIEAELSPLHLIELAGRTCYRSEDKITKESAEKFVRMIRDNGHESVLEHSAMTVDFTIDRGVSHEMVRHRLCAFSQESTRYCNYVKDKFGSEISLIEPFFFDPAEAPKYVSVPVGYNLRLPVDGINEWEFSAFETHKLNSFDVWFLTCLWAEWGYMTLVNEFGRSAQEARSVLPNSLKTKITVTANFREWRHIFRLRCGRRAHPQMREIMIPLLERCKEVVPVIFDDIEV